VLEVSWAEFQEQLASATTIAEVQQLHARYLERALHRCFLSEKTASVQIFTPIFESILAFKRKVMAVDLTSRLDAAVFQGTWSFSFFYSNGK
jgi:hypothetical protein